ncbi:MAG TPA: pyridoxamine 5'-phosphate oxidase family protein, partial [Candidatus Binatus sp.]|nr:pyridoxamine 5'-phosphate oxidase family protein [Candidatus Binatus sp.]
MQRRKTIALTPDEQQQYLDGSHTIILTSLDRHGYPHSIAMWYVVDPDGAVVMTTFAKSQKTLNLRRDPRCALLLESGRT